MKKIKTFLRMTLMPYILSLFVRFIYITNKKVYHHPKVVPNEPVIFSTWHGHLLMQVFSYNYFKKEKKLKSIISSHRDGEIIGKIMAYFGIMPINGSSTRGGVKALLGSIKSLKDGYDVAITPDGPKGPIYEVASGIVAIAQKTNSYILAAKVVPTKYWSLSSWDKFIVPKPFGRIDFYIGEPFSIKDLDEVEAKKLIKRKMEEIG